MKPMKFSNIRLLVLIIFNLSCSDIPTPTPGVDRVWRLVHTQGLMYFAYIDPAYSAATDQYDQAIDPICGTKSICQIIFWDNESLIPSSLPMTDDQVNAKIAHYQFNAKTSLRRLILDNK